MKMNESGIKIAAQVSPNPSEEDIAFIKEMGLKYVVLFSKSEDANYDYFMKHREIFEPHGIKIYGFGNSGIHNHDSLVLNLSDRDEVIEEYKKYIRDLGKAEIPYSTYAHMGNGIWSTSKEPTRGGALGRAFNLDAETFYLNDRKGPRTISKGKLTHSREYSEEELWGNFEYYIKAVKPTIEESGVKVGIHPDDPPGLKLGGIPRCIFSTFSGYQRALEIADSPNIGICLCAGTWLEGGDTTEKNVTEMAKYFGDQNKLFKIHFRNVDKPLPHFKETFLDGGYMDMYKIIKVLKEVDFDGIIIPDHNPTMGSLEDRGSTDPHWHHKEDKYGVANRTATAFAIGYMKALVERAEEE
jgi:mannonate dehydratase